MAKIIGNKPICFIQGASYDIRRKFNEDVTANIVSVFVTANDIDLNVQLQKTQDDVFTYRLGADFTKALKPQEITYDLTVIYEDGSVAKETGIPFIVQKCINPIEEENNGE